MVLTKLWHGLSSVDGLLCRVSDWTAEQLWVWLNVRRKLLMQFLVVVYAILSSYSDISKQRWGSLGITGVVFIINYSAASTPQQPSHPCLEGMFRVLRLFMLWIVLFCGLCCVLGDFGKCDFIAMVALVWFVYLSRAVSNKGKRKEQRLLLTELKKLFGAEWIPAPQPNEW